MNTFLNALIWITAVLLCWVLYRTQPPGVAIFTSAIIIVFVALGMVDDEGERW